MKRNTKWILGAAIVVVLLGGVFTIGHLNSKQATGQANKTITVGVAPGPYGDMAKNVLGPLLKKEGFTIKTKEFNDYIQPNKALSSGEIDANLFQHTAYLKTFSKANNLKLTAIAKTPTLGMGIYSKKITKLSALKKGDTVSLANDPSNLARSLQLLAANKLVTLKSNINVAKASLADITSNPKKLKFKALDAAQLPQSQSNVTIALIPGNYSWNANLNPAKALALENLSSDYQEVFVVKTSEKNSKFAKAIKKVLNSQAFKTAIAKSKFKNFQHPDTWK